MLSITNGLLSSPDFIPSYKFVDRNTSRNSKFPYAKFFEQLRVDVTATVVVEHIERLGVNIRRIKLRPSSRLARRVMPVMGSQICNGCYAIR